MRDTQIRDRSIYWVQGQVIKDLRESCFDGTEGEKRK